MNRYQFAIWVALLLCPLSGLALEIFGAQDLDSYVLQLNVLCPITCGDQWAVNSVTADGDTVWVELEAPGVLDVFLSTLTEDSPGVKRLWKNQMLSFGNQWERLMDLLVEAGHSLVLFIRPQDSDSSAYVAFNPDELKNEQPASRKADPNR